MRLIKADFEKLQQFLRDEEVSILNALKAEQEQKSRKMKERMDRLADEIMSLTEIITSTEEAMGSEDTEFLKVKGFFRFQSKKRIYSPNV